MSMRLVAVALGIALVLSSAAGCRQSLVPTLANQPPETWIVAAPQDTITTRDDNGVPIRPQPGRIPVRFHMYWAGSDVDGTVTGFFWAVVETLPLPPDGVGPVPPLPGPKARDYRFTTRTDSIFVFSASEDASERQHAFYIYAVDDKGRPDPTPARFVFSSYDRFPPLAVIDECRADGTEYELKDGGVEAVQKTYFVTDFFEISNAHPFPRDTVSANAVLHMRWHGVPTIASTIVTGYRYKLDEPEFNTVDSSVHVAAYNTGVGADRVNTGKKIFWLRAIGQSGWRGEATRWFQMNFAPDSWYSGPDPNDASAGWQTSQDGTGKRYWYKDFGVSHWNDAFHGVPGTMLSADSAFHLPAARGQRKAFFEAYDQRLWLRQEDDTVHLNSWVIIPGGGFDRDSPYTVPSNMLLLGDSLRQFPVLTPGPPNGSPIGFRIRVQVKDAGGQLTQPSESTTYPVVDPASPKENHEINGYWGVTTAGRAYAVVRAEDGNGTVDERLDHQPGGAVGVADRVDGHGGSVEDKALRSKVLTFYVNHAPALLPRQQGFYPRAGAVLTSREVGQNGAPPFNLAATDDDWFDPSLRGPTGGPPTTYTAILRWKLAIVGRTCDTCRDTCYIVPGDFPRAFPISFTIPNWIVNGDIKVRVRLCDCAECDALVDSRDNCPFAGREASPGDGTCVDTDISCTLDAPPVGP